MSNQVKVTIPESEIKSHGWDNIAQAQEHVDFIVAQKPKDRKQPFTENQVVRSMLHGKIVYSTKEVTRDARSTINAQAGHEVDLFWEFRAVSQRTISGPT